MVKKKKITMTVEKTKTGFSAFSADYPIFTTGQSIPELINNTYEAAEFYFEEEKVKVEPTDIGFEIQISCRKNWNERYPIISICFGN